MDLKTKRSTVNIVDRPINKRKTEVSLSAFCFLFAELVQYTRNRVRGVEEFEKRLSDVGYQVGLRLLELLNYREKGAKRETKLVQILSFIHGTVWKTIFGKQADSLEKSTVNDDEYMIIENQLVITKYISSSKDLGGLTCAEFVSGIVHGILEGAQFTPEKVTAHSITPEGSATVKTVIVIKFKKSVIDREKRLAN